MEMAKALNYMQIDSYFNPLSSLLMTGAVLWVSWRLWRFTVLPKIYPNEPKQLPYWIRGTSEPSFFISCALVAHGTHVTDRVNDSYRPCSRHVHELQ
jgi:hypothetical protein